MNPAMFISEITQQYSLHTVFIMRWTLILQSILRVTVTTNELCTNDVC